MNSTPSKFVVREHIPTIVAHVFETMLGLQTAPAAATQSFGFERVSGTIGIAGEHVNGTVYFHLPGRLARDVTAAMLQTGPGQEVGDGDVNDVLGELSNMIACRLKSLLNDADIFCAVSTPSVIRGAFAVEAPQDVTAEIFYFSCMEQRFAVEVHLQITETPEQPI